MNPPPPSDSQVKPDLEGKPPLGRGLLPADFGKYRLHAEGALSGAYSAIMADKVANFRFWNGVRVGLIRGVRREYEKHGLTAPPLHWKALWKRVDHPVPSGQPMDHVHLVVALLTDFQDVLADHIRYRLATGGNVHLEFTGPTGMGKSSCAIALADWISTIAPENLADHLSFDLGQLPTKLKTKKAGQTVVQDEYVQNSGAGAKTAQSLFANLEDTLRASQVNLFAVSPRMQDHGTMQAVLELIAWSPPEDLADGAKRCPKCRTTWTTAMCRCGWQPYSVFLLWIAGVPHGVVALPWARKELWDAYGPWKKGNTDRSKSGQFNDRFAIAKSAIRACEEPAFVEFMASATAKPKKTDFESGLEFFHPEMLSSAQRDQLVNWFYYVCYGWQRIEPNLEKWFGSKPNDGLRRIALRCYKE